MDEEKDSTDASSTSSALKGSTELWDSQKVEFSVDLNSNKSCSFNCWKASITTNTLQLQSQGAIIRDK